MIKGLLALSSSIIKGLGGAFLILVELMFLPFILAFFLNKYDTLPSPAMVELNVVLNYISNLKYYIFFGTWFFNSWYNYKSLEEVI